MEWVSYAIKPFKLGSAQNCEFYSNSIQYINNIVADVPSSIYYYLENFICGRSDIPQRFTCKANRLTYRLTE